MFVAPVKGLPKMFVCRIDGRDLQRLSRTTGSQVEPFYSEPLGRFFFVRLVDKRQQIYSVNLEGEDLRAHTDGVSQARHPNVSPDGKTLIYSTDTWGSLELAQIDLATGKSTRLTYDQAINTYPRFSPDGQKILYLSRRHGQAELYLRDAASGDLRRLSQTSFNEGPGSWRPDGKRIVATRVLPPRLESRLLEIDLENGSERILLRDIKPVEVPTYSSDGNTIIFLRQQSIWTYDPSDTVSLPFPVRGNFLPTYVQWVEFPLP